MQKFNFNLLIVTLICCIPFISSSCSKTQLYCFTSNYTTLGAINVDQCWRWTRFSCQPCLADTTLKLINLQNYLIDCNKIYPEATQVLFTKSFLAEWRRRVINEIHIGK